MLFVGLIESRAGTSVAGESLEALRLQLEGELARCAAAVGRPLSEQATATERVARATALAMLGETIRARETLEPCAAEHLGACLLTASIYQDERDYAKSAQWYQKALAMTDMKREAEQAERDAGRLRAFEGIAFAARATRDFAASESTYRRALGELPEHAALLHYRLGQHYAAVGDAAAAVAAFDRAAAADRSAYGDLVAGEIRRLRQTTPACLPWGR